MLKNKYFVILIVLACLNALGILYFFSESLERSDTSRYVQTIEYFLGSAPKPALSSLVKPLSIITAALIAPLASPRGALFLQNLLFYLAGIILVFKIIERLYASQKQALYGAVLFMASFPVLQNGLSFLTDMSGWFFLLLAIYLTLNFYQKPDFKSALIAGLLSGMGFLFKESGGAGAVFFAFLLLISKKFLWHDKIKYGLTFTIFMAVPILLSVIFISAFFGYTYLDWYKENLQSSARDYNFKIIITELSVMFLLGWFFAIRGIFKEHKEKVILWAMLPLFFTGFLWPVPAARVLFLGIMPLLLLASRGLLFTGKIWLEISLLSLFTIINYSLPNIFNIEDLDGFLGLILPGI